MNQKLFPLIKSAKMKNDPFKFLVNLFTVFLFIFSLVSYYVHYRLLAQSIIVLFFVLLLIVVIYALILLRKIIIWSTAHYSFYTLSSLLILFFWLIYTGLSYKTLSGETAIQTICALNKIKEIFTQSSNDLFFHTSCHLDYPWQQFIPTALSSILFTVNLLTLNYGGKFYIFIALPIFAYFLLKFNDLVISEKMKQTNFFYLKKIWKKIKKYDNDSSLVDILTAIVLIVIFHITYLNHFLFVYAEQSYYPFAYGLLVVAIIIACLNRRQYVFNDTHSTFIYALGGFLTYLFIHSYTPSLSLVPLMWLIFLFLKNYNILILSFLELAISLVHRGDLNRGNTEKSIEYLMKVISTLVKHIFQVDYVGSLHLTWKLPNTFLSPYLHFGVLTLFFISIVWYWRIRINKKQLFFIFLSLYILMILFVSTYLNGYLIYDLGFKIVRAVVIGPFLLLFINQALQKFVDKVSLKIWQLLFFVILLSGLVYSLIMTSLIPVKKPAVLYYKLIEIIKVNQLVQPRFIYVLTSGRENEFISIGDAFNYLFPQSKIVVNSYDYLDNCLSATMIIQEKGYSDYQFNTIDEAVDSPFLVKERTVNWRLAGNNLQFLSTITSSQLDFEYLVYVCGMGM